MSSPAPRSVYANGSTANIVRSLLVIGAIVAVLVAIVPRVSSVSQPPVDVAGTAEQVAADTGWPISAPRDLPEGWRATHVPLVRAS